MKTEIFLSLGLHKVLYVLVTSFWASQIRIPNLETLARLNPDPNTASCSYAHKKTYPCIVSSLDFSSPSPFTRDMSLQQINHILNIVKIIWV
jgi:hypothetical protein